MPPGFGRRRWGRALLVAGQVAVSVVLLVVATFIYRDFQQQLGAGPGFRTDHLLMMSFDPSLVQLQRAVRRSSSSSRSPTRARSVPGVKSVALALIDADGTDGLDAVDDRAGRLSVSAGEETA